MFWRNSADGIWKSLNGVRYLVLTCELGISGWLVQNGERVAAYLFTLVFVDLGGELGGIFSI